MKHVTAVLSMLHESADRNSATRQFRGNRVLSWTLDRLSRCDLLEHRAILCWEDQLPQFGSLVDEFGCHVLVKGPRSPIPSIDAIGAAQRWSDGWRGGLLGTCAFDRGFHARWIDEIADHLRAEAIVLVDPSSGLVDPQLIDELVRHARRHESQPLVFAQAAPGSAGALVRRSLLQQLAESNLHPGRLLAYQPSRPQRDAIATDAAINVPTLVARTSHRFTLDSDRQIARIEASTLSLNGTLAVTAAEQLVQRVSSADRVDAMPREVTLELTTRRSVRPIYSAAQLPIARADMTLELAQTILDQLAHADDTRLVLAGVGDPLLSPIVADVIAYARARGIESIAIETDLLAVNSETLDAVSGGAVDVVSVMIPAISQETYARIMGAPRIAEAVENLKSLLTKRQQLARGVPIVVPTFVKCRENLHEMESWYDQWINALGTAVIRGPSTCGGKLPDVSVSPMAPPTRRACSRLSSRLTILSDGAIVPCEEDVLGSQTLGRAGVDRIADVWQHTMSPLRDTHRTGNVLSLPVCGSCDQWARP